MESNGPNPSLHQEGDQSAYLGDKSVVTGHYAGQAGYEQGYYEYMMAPEFDNEFSQYKFPCDGGDGMQWQIPADNIARFNELITGQRHGIGKVAVWVPVWRFQLSG